MCVIVHSKLNPSLFILKATIPYVDIRPAVLNIRKEQRTCTCHRCEKKLNYNEIINNEKAGAPTPDGEIDYDYCWDCFAFLKNIGFTEDNYEMEGEPTKYVCGVCNNEYTARSSYRRHLEKHTSEKYLCSRCPKRFTYKSSLREHEKMHQDSGANKCGTCKKVFRCKFTLTRHMRIHTGEKPFLCSTCGRGFNQNSTLVQHERLHNNIRPYACTECGKRFTQSTTRNQHMKSVHGQKWFQGKGILSDFIKRALSGFFFFFQNLSYF